MGGLTAMDESAGSSSTALSEQTCAAVIATWVRLLTPSLRMISRTWTFTVVSVMPSLRPITLLGSPWQRHARTAYCRSVNSGACRRPWDPLVRWAARRLWVDDAAYAERIHVLRRSPSDL